MNFKDNFKDFLLSLKAYLILTIMIILILLFLIIMVLFLPLYYINKKYYRILTNNILRLVVPSFLAPLSWRNINIYINNNHKLYKNDNKNCIYMANHAGRIDWLIALWFSYVGKPKKVNFIAEITNKYMPGIGWLRNLCEDIYVSRSFKQDESKIKENLNSFNNDNILRDIFFSPEGIIADKNNYDISMIKNCEEFCKINNLKPFEYVLTPRYKGLSCLIDKNNKYYTFTIAYVKDNKLMNTKLMNDSREIPDLITLLKYDIDVYLYCKEIKLNKLKKPEDLKKILMKRYKMHDKYLKHFEENIETKKEFFKNQSSKEPFHLLPKEYIFKTNIFIMSYFLIYNIAKRYDYNSYLKKIFMYTFFSLSVSHFLGEYISGYSRESVPFETLTKSILFNKRDKNKYCY